MMTRGLWVRGGGPRGRLRGALAVLVLAGPLLALAVSAPPSVGSASAASASAQGMSQHPFSREIVRPGDVDTDPYHIEHVYEVQYRLERLALFDAVPNGHFGPITEAGVKAFQKSNGLTASG